MHLKYIEIIYEPWRIFYKPLDLTLSVANQYSGQTVTGGQGLFAPSSASQAEFPFLLHILPLLHVLADRTTNMFSYEDL